MVAVDVAVVEVGVLEDDSAGDLMQPLYNAAKSTVADRMAAGR